MHRINAAALAVAAVALIPAAGVAQDAPRPVEGGGIKVPGWAGKIDAREASRGAKLEGAVLEKVGDALHVKTGPAVTYWHPDNKASGNYTVKATFKEDQFMALNDHPHPYGIVIAGNDLGTDQQSYLYCAAYGTGTFIVRGFGPEPFQVNGRRGEPSGSVNKASGKGAPVSQEIALSVTDDKIECAINGKVVGSYPKADLVTAGKLKSTDGVYGIRFGHNTEATITGLTVTKK